MAIRQAVLDDVSAIRDLFTAGISRWQRMTESGQVEDLLYGELTIYERWLHGGAWMAVETAALWLTHLIAHDAMVLVVDEDGTITGYLEALQGDEAPPFGQHIHIGQLVGEDTSTREALVEALASEVQAVDRLTISSSPYDEEALKFYRSLGFIELAQIKRMSLAAQGATVGFYKVTEHLPSDAEQIETWQMPIGRVESARHHWEQLWPQLWQAVPEMATRRTHRLRFNAGGQDAFVLVQEQLYNPRSAEVYCWTPKALSTHLVGAIRDWSYKAGYRTLTMAVDEKIAAILDSDLEASAYQHIILARNL